MAASYTCDGCGCNLAKPKQAGYVVPRDYCDECLPKAAAFLEADAMLRANAAQVYSDARTRLIATAAMDDFKLPDVP